MIEASNYVIVKMEDVEGNFDEETVKTEVKVRVKVYKAESNKICETAKCFYILFELASLFIIEYIDPP